MSGTAKNLIAMLGLATVAFAGYYLYTQPGASSLNSAANEQTLNEMKMKTDVFIQHRQVLDEVSIDESLFEDNRFRSLRPFTRPLQDMPTGRANPFAPAGSAAVFSEDGA